MLLKHGDFSFSNLWSGTKLSDLYFPASDRHELKSADIHADECLKSFRHDWVRESLQAQKQWNMLALLRIVWEHFVIEHRRKCLGSILVPAHYHHTWAKSSNFVASHSRFFHFRNQDWKCLTGLPCANTLNRALFSGNSCNTGRGGSHFRIQKVPGEFQAVPANGSQVESAGRGLAWEMESNCEE